MTNIVAAKAIVASDHAQKLAEASGPHLCVATTGAKRWRLEYRRRYRENLLTISNYGTGMIAPAELLAVLRPVEGHGASKPRAGSDSG